MDFQSIFNLIGGALLTAIGWWCREIWDSVKKLKEDIDKLVDFSVMQEVHAALKKG